MLIAHTSKYTKFAALVQKWLSFYFVTFSLLVLDCESSNETLTEEIVHHTVQFDTSFPANFVLVDVESEEKRHPIKKLNITTIDFHPIICGTRNYIACVRGS